MDWFRSYHGAPTDPKWRVIAARVTQCNAAAVTVTPGCVTAVFWALLDHASQASERGSVAGIDTETLASAFDWPEAKILAIIAAFKEKNIISNNRLSAWDKRQPKREDDSLNRVRRYRDKQSVTHGNAEKRNVTIEQNREEQNREEQINTPQSPPSFDFDAWFAHELWLHFPRRIGKGAARRAAKVALKKTSPETLLEAVKRHARDMAGKDEQYIPHPATWLNQERWLDQKGNGHDLNGLSKQGKPHSPPPALTKREIRPDDLV